MCSKTPQFNATYEYVFDEVTTFPGYPGSTVMTKTDANTLTEVWTKADGVGSHSFVLKFNNFGVVVRTSTSSGGLVATSVYERVKVPSFCGFYLLESHENVGTLMNHLTSDEVAEMLANCAIRVTRTADGVYTSTDYFGTGAEKKMTFRLNEQTELGALDDFQMKDAVLLVTQTGPTSLSFVVKDRATGRVQTWIGEVTEDTFTWTIEAAPGVVTRFTYRRVGDIMGSWKLAVYGDPTAYFDALGVPAAVQEAMKAERPTGRFAYLGKGLWEYSSDGKVTAHEPCIGR
jgi:hypothetical protein